MPIVCVDIIAQDPQGAILLVERRNEPCRGLLWTPGGRVLRDELRLEAARRILREEVNLHATSFVEVATLDAMLPISTNGAPSSHAVTTFFAARVRDPGMLALDGQGESAVWANKRDLVTFNLHPLLRSAFARLTS